MELIHLKEMLNKKGENAKLSKTTNISTGNICDWINPNKKATPSAEALCKIADYYNCSVDYLLDRTEIKEINANCIIYRFPIYDQQAAAGAGITGRDGNYELEDIIADNIPNDAVYGIRIKGHSMETEIPDGSIVLINPKIDKNYLNGKNVIVEIDGEVICKQYRICENYVHFKSLNDEYSDLDRYVYDDKYRIIGEVVKVI